MGKRLSAIEELSKLKTYPNESLDFVMCRVIRDYLKLKDSPDKQVETKSNQARRKGTKTATFIPVRLADESKNALDGAE